MKQSVSPAVAVIAVVIVAVIAGFLMFRAASPPPNMAANMSAAEYQRKMQEQSGKAAEAMKQKPQGGNDYASKMKSMYSGGSQKPEGGN